MFGICDLSVELMNYICELELLLVHDRTWFLDVDLWLGHPMENEYSSLSNGC